MKPIAIPRPIDPELAAQWDEAKRNVQDRDCCVGDVTRCRCAVGAKQLAMSDEDVDREKWLQVWSEVEQ